MGRIFLPDKNMITKISKITFNKSGAGSTSGRVTIPSDFLKLLNITEDNREIRLVYDQDEKKIIIEKDFGEFYYPDGTKDYIDVECTWGIKKIDDKEIKIIFGADGLFLGFKEKEDIKLYSEDIEYKKWEEYEERGEYK